MTVFPFTDYRVTIQNKHPMGPVCVVTRRGHGDDCLCNGKPIHVFSSCWRGCVGKIKIKAPSSLRRSAVHPFSRWTGAYIEPSGRIAM